MKNSRLILLLVSTTVLFSFLIFSCKKKEKHAQLTGTVLFDGTGIGILGATVTLKNSKTTQDGTTNGEGNFTIDKIKLGDGYKITISHQDYETFTSNTISIVDEGSLPHRVFRLKKKQTGLGQIKGNVKIFGKNTTIPGVVVRIENSDFEISTNNIGEYILKDIPPGNYNITTASTKFEPSGSHSITVEADKIAVKNFQLKSNGGIQGNVYILGTQTGISGANLFLHGPNDVVLPISISEKKTTGTTGNYAFENLPDGLYKLNVKHPDYNDESEEVSVINGKKTAFDFGLKIKPPLLETSLSALRFGSSENQKKLILLNNGKGTITWNIESLPIWLKVEPQTSSFQETKEISFTADRNVIGDGEHKAQIKINGNEAGTKLINVSISKGVIKPELDVDTELLHFEEGETEKRIIVRNVGKQLLKWKASSHDSWIAITPKNSGELSPDGEYILTIGVNREGLKIGPYESKINFTSQNNGGSHEVKVTMEVTEVAYTDTIIKMSGLLAYYPFNGNHYDQGPNPDLNESYLIGGVEQIQDRHGASGKALYFNGIDGYMGIQNPIKSEEIDAFSISLWVNPQQHDDTPNQYMIFLGKETRIWFNIEQSSFSFGNIQYNKCDGFSCNFWTSKVNHNASNGWKHIVLIYKKGDFMKIYTNGSFNNQTNIGSHKIKGQTGLKSALGCAIETNNIQQNFFKGSIDDVAFFNRALTPSEIRMLSEL